MRRETSALEGQTIGFIGLGLMGRPMARNLHSAGAELIVQNRSAGPVEELAVEGMAAAATPGAVANQVNTIILMLTDTAAVKAVITGPGGLLGGLRQDTLVIDMGTTLLSATKELAAKVAKVGGRYIDAPVSLSLIHI